MKFLTWLKTLFGGPAPAIDAQRIEVASRILAGFAANPAVFGPNERCG